LAEAVAKGAQSVPDTKVSLVPVAEAEARQAELDGADAIIFGSPTYMGGVSAEFAKFKDSTSKRWMGGVAQQARRGLHGFGVVERRQAQHAVPASERSPCSTACVGRPRPAGRLQPFQGVDRGPQSPGRVGRCDGAGHADQGVEGIAASDFRTMEALGKRVAEAAQRWREGAARERRPKGAGQSRPAGAITCRMSPPLHRVASDEKLPDAADVVVIGAGMAGSAAAYALAKKGLSVAPARQGSCRRRADQPQLGLVPPASIAICASCRWRRRVSRSGAKLAAELGSDPAFAAPACSTSTTRPPTLPCGKPGRLRARDYQMHSHVLKRRRSQGHDAGQHRPVDRRRAFASDGKAETVLAGR